MERGTGSKPPFFALLRVMAQAWQNLERYALDDIRESGLSAPQFDVLCTLGDNDGLTFTELGERTLIYKTTLTGVVDRLADKGLVERAACDLDRRRIYVRVTPAGKSLVADILPRHVAHLERRLGQLSAEEVDEAIRVLTRLRDLR